MHYAGDISQRRGDVMLANAVIWWDYESLASFAIRRCESSYGPYGGGDVWNAVHYIYVYAHKITNSQLNLPHGTKQERAMKKLKTTRMWADAQRDGRPAEHRWRRLFDAAKFD